MFITKKFTFDAAHYLPNYNGKCEHLHGHTYALNIKVQGEPDAEGLVIDFAKLKKLVQELVLSKLDHALLNDIMPNPSAETICVWVWEELYKKLEGPNYKLYAVEVWETATSGCEYRGELSKGASC
jgi:6-pyruvoyltetrahydropterin/6-carboxytetrahydropterin synthase